MNLFTRLYDKALIWARHRHAQWYLAGLSFAEASFLPVPPDVMLVPMSLATPRRAWHFALLTTLASAVGGVFGYMIGYFAFELAEPLINELGYHEAFLHAKEWFDQWGVWVVFVAGFSPIPYKVFTIAAGTVSMALLPFFIASVIGRGARFYLVAGLISWGGVRMERFLRTYIDKLGWFLVLVAVVVFIMIQL
jgi:membrane protein YqaA with SNARE-associated domain